MPVKRSWDNPEQTVVRYDFEGWWTWDELYRSVAPKRTRAVVLNMLEGTPFPRTPFPMGKSASLTIRTNTITIVVTRNLLLLLVFSILSMLSAFTSTHFYVVTSLKAARQLLLEKGGTNS